MISPQELQHKILDEARDLLNADQFKESSARLEYLLKRDDLSPEVRANADIMAIEIRAKRELRIVELKEQAESLFRQRKWEEARRNLLEALTLDPRDHDARKVLMTVDAEQENDRREKTIRQTKVDLHELNDIQKLGEAVREAEDLVARGQADDELIHLLRTARQKWSDLRSEHGIVTTKGRLASLTDRAETVKQLESLIMNNQLIVWDATLDAYRNTADVLQDARRSWEERSQSAASEILEFIMGDLPPRLDLARARLEESLKHPFSEQQRILLKTRLDEIQRMVESRNRAEELVEQARKQDNPLAALSLLREAHSIWSHLEGLERRIAEQQELAAAYFLSATNTTAKDLAIFIQTITDSNLRAKVAYQKGTELIEQNRWDEGITLLEESLAVYRQNDDLKSHADTIYQIARAHHLLSNFEEARTRYRDALRLYEHLRNSNGIAACNVGLGRLNVQTGDPFRALRELNAARQIYLEINDEQHLKDVEEVIHLIDRVTEAQAA